MQSLMVTKSLQEPIFSCAIHALNLPPGTRGLDVGCGIGLQAIMLAEAVREAGHVTGDVYAPLSDEIRSALTALIEMRWVDVRAELSEED